MTFQSPFQLKRFYDLRENILQAQETAEANGE